MIFERELETNIFELQVDLKAGRYRHDRYIPFTAWDPKQRQIHKAVVRDRLVHQAVVNVIEPLFEPSFIYDSFSCRKGKGTHAGVNRLRKFLRQASCNNGRNVYGLKCDVHKFFASVDHAKLLDLLALSQILKRREGEYPYLEHQDFDVGLSPKIIDEKTLMLLKEIITSFETSPGKGIPLGNLTSQLFANVYMHQLDWFVKHNLREKFYLRYCDDFMIVGTDREHLAKLVEPIAEFLNRQLGLNLHPSKIVLRSWEQGIDFVGYVSKPYCTVLRTKTKNRMLSRANTKNLSSYLGLCRHANSYHLRQELLSKLWIENKLL